MITCHLINVLKAFQSPLQDKSQNWNRIISACTYGKPTHTHASTYTFTVHQEMSLTVIWGCSYEYSLFVHNETQYKLENEVGGWREKSSGMFSANGEGYKVYVRLIPNNKQHKSQTGAILVNERRGWRGKGCLGLCLLKEHLSTLAFSQQ